MIISNSNKFIFIHIHKSAGTSIGNNLDQYCTWNDLSIGYKPNSIQYFKSYGLDKHKKGDQIKKIIGNYIWSSYFKFAFVRNPFTRAVSLYTYIKQLLSEHKSRKLLHLANLKYWEPLDWDISNAFLQTKSFTEFIRHPSYIYDYGCQPQSNFVTDSKTQKLTVDFIGKLENIEEDFGFVRKKLGYSKQFLFHSNVSNRKLSLADYYRTEDDFEVIRNLYNSDFDLFHYSKESLNN